jgi:predicted nucleic acid-binding Zn ribbon protein
MDDVTRINDALQAYLETSGIEFLLKNQKVCNAWQKVVGQEIAPQTQVAGFDKGVLVIEVASSSLYAELSNFHLRALVEAMQREMKNKKVRKIKLRLGHFSEDQEDGKEKQQSERKK